MEIEGVALMLITTTSILYNNEGDDVMKKLHYTIYYHILFSLYLIF